MVNVIQADVEKSNNVVDVSERQHSSMSHFIAGGVAGVVSKTCTAPLARLTILFQVQSMGAAGSHSVDKKLRGGMLQEASRIVREEGVRAFWKGNAVTNLHRIPYASTSFVVYEQLEMSALRLLGTDAKQPSLRAATGMFMAGVGAAVVASSAVYPLDLVRTRLAAQKKVVYYRGIMHAFSSIYNEDGLRGLYKGLRSTLVHVGPNVGVNFAVSRTLKSCLSFHMPDSPNVASLVSGSVAGICSSTATYPLDLVRRRMQLQGAAGHKAPACRMGIGGTLRHVVQTEGYRGLYRGLLPELCRVAPSVGIMFVTYDFVKRSYLSLTCQQSFGSQGDFKL